ncbi:MAG: hypothetical protein KGL53_15530, partial [Elusimicrobia bacterium]|nr:hypothetical protein [Elusimicrobiota bacterium]
RLRLRLEKSGVPPGPEWKKAAARLELGLAVKAKLWKDAVSSFEELMRLGGGCELPYRYFEVESALAEVSPEERRAALETARAALVPVANARWFGKPEDRCADSRSLAEATAEVYDGLGRATERSAFLDGVVAELERREAAAGGPGQDRNLDDDMRFFLDLSGRKDALEAFLGKLVAAYPSDYVYPYRTALFLRGEHRDADALAYAEKSYRLSYGGNRFSAARLYAELLAEAGRKKEASALLRRELRAARAHFQDQVPALRKTLKKIGG